jgi:hypothetical protein
MAESIVNEWKSSLHVIRVTNENELAVVEWADFSDISFQSFQPDAQFLFQRTAYLQLKIISPSAVSVNTDSIDLFSAIHSMPNLKSLILNFYTVKQVDHFTPSLPKLRHLTLDMYDDIGFGPIAFDHLTGLESFIIRGSKKKEFTMFETGLAPRYLYICGFDLLKFNSADAANIKRIDTYGMVESVFPLSELTDLCFNPVETLVFPVYFRQFTNLSCLRMSLKDLSQVNRGQLSCLSKLSTLILIQESTAAEGIL